MRSLTYDEQLADRVRELLSARAGVSEREMFGGIGFMVEGNMAVGIRGHELIVRLDPDDAAGALSEPGVREFDLTGRPMKGWVFAGAEAIGDPDGLRSWVEAGADYAASLPPK
jgi:TfoX/Sxy family transcriptional regulator of competence genes